MNKKRFFSSYKSFWKNYFNFDGKSNRSEYWWTFLWNAVIILVLVLLAIGFFLGTVHKVGFSIYLLFSIIFYVLTILYILAIIFPTISINMRRFRDIGISPWWILLTLILPAFLLIISGNLSLPLKIVSGVLFIVGLIIAIFPSKEHK